jgi:hypothetical protein
MIAGEYTSSGKKEKETMLSKYSLENIRLMKKNSLVGEHLNAGWVGFKEAMQNLMVNTR